MQIHRKMTVAVPFLKKFIGLKSVTLLQKDSATGVSVKNFQKFSKLSEKFHILQNTIGRLLLELVNENILENSCPENYFNLSR